MSKNKHLPAPTERCMYTLELPFNNEKDQPWYHSAEQDETRKKAAPTSADAQQEQKQRT